MMDARTDILVLGSLHFDLMVRAPLLPRLGETVQGEKCWWQFGGKGGNQAVAAAKADPGLDVEMIGRVGTDDYARPLLEGLEQNGIGTGYITRDPAHPSGMSVATLDDQGDYTAVILSGANQNIDQRQIAVAEVLFEEARILLLQNEVNEDANIEAARLAKHWNVLVCLNAAPTKRLPRALVELVDILVVNAIEAEGLGADPVDSLATAQQAAQMLSGATQAVIVTAGAHGVAWSEKGAVASLPAEQVIQANTHGAGDCFMGHLAARLARDEHLADAIKAANHAAARHVAGGV